MPEPKLGESEASFVERCIPIVIDDGTAKDGKQAAAVCHSLYRSGKSMDLLELIRQRQSKQTEFNYGIHTADVYARTLLECVGSDLCYRYGAKGNVSFDDAVKRASKTLSYANPDMITEDIYLDWKSRFADGVTDIELPKNTLMVFRHVLTTPRKDRDGDILRTKGAKPDPKMLLLWQHVHTLPIGKMLGVAEHTTKKLSLVTAIVDLNELSHDAAVMVDNDMGRFSHGFKALEFASFKEEEGRTTGEDGFDVKSFEIMEESLVSVPSNVDSETEEVMLSLIESDKLSSSMMKSYGKRIRSNRPKQVQGSGPLDLTINFTVNGKKVNSDGESDDEPSKSAAACACGSGNKSAPEETDSDKGSKAAEKDKAKDKEVDDHDDKNICPECGSELNDEGMCEECGYEMKAKDDKSAAEELVDTKVGRVLSRSNYDKLVEVSEDLDELHKMHVSTRSGKALCSKCYKMVMDVVKSAGQDTDIGEASVEQAGALILEKATRQERLVLLKALEALHNIDEQTEETGRVFNLIGSTGLN